jgi:hypothetical protein
MMGEEEEARMARVARQLHREAVGELMGIAARLTLEDVEVLLSVAERLDPDWVGQDGEEIVRLAKIQP